MERIFKLQSKQEDETSLEIDGRSFVRVYTKEFDKQPGPLFFMNNGTFISNRPLDAEKKEHEMVWRFSFNGAEPTGRFIITKEDKKVDHTKLTAYFKYDDSVTEENHKAIKEKDFAKFMQYQVVKLLKNHAETEFFDANGVNQNPNTIIAKYVLTDITQQHQSNFDKEMLTHEQMAVVLSLFKSDYKEFENVCYGFGLGQQIKEAGENKNQLFGVLSKLISNDPEKFRVYYSNKEYAIIVNKAIDKGFITLNGNAYFINGEIAGSTTEEVENYLRLHKISLDYVKMKLGMLSESEVLEPKSSTPQEPDGDVFDKGYVRNEVKYQSSFNQKRKFLIKKYQNNNTSLDLLHKELLDICREKGWEDHEKVLLSDSASGTVHS